MDESVNEGLEEIQNMIMALTELIKSVPMLEMKIETLEKKIDTLEIKVDTITQSLEHNSSEDNADEEVKTAIAEGFSQYYEHIESTFSTFDTRLVTAENIIKEQYQQLYSMIKSLSSNRQNDDENAPGELMKKFDDLCHLTLGQYDELKSIISDVELNLQSKYQELHRTINKDG